ncbi:MAG: hypothetical protein AAF170_10020 [Bacteroidota bacterium]
MRLVLVALAIGLSIPSTSAQVAKELLELGGSGFLTVVRGNVNLSLSPRVGYFVSDRVEVGINPLVFTNFDGEGSAVIAAFGAYHFVQDMRATTVPFAGGSLGANVSSGGGLAIGAEGGIKQFVIPGGAVTVSAFISTTGDFNPFTTGVQGGVAIFL